MKRLRLILLVSLLIIILPGCWDRKDLENVSFSTVIGLDLDQDNKLLIYTIVPIFSKEAKKKEDTLEVRAYSLRASRGKVDAYFDGAVTGRKLQVLLLGKRLLMHEDWFPLLDVLYRDTKNAVTADVVYVDGPVSQVIDAKFPEKPRLSLYLSQMIESASERNETVKTTMHELHRQLFEKGITPAISELKLGKKLELTGTALLNNKGKHVASLRFQEDELLRILQKQAMKNVSLSLPLPQMKKSDIEIFNNDVVSFNLEDLKTKIKTNYHDGHFQFDIRIRSNITLTEREFPFDLEKNSGELEKMIEEQLEQKFEKLIHKIQKHKIDPIGLGIYARAHEYKEWQQVQDGWGKALSKAEIMINLKLMVNRMGPVK